MAEEVRIVAVLDSSDIDSGVKRVENAARRMKQVVEEAVPGNPDRMIKAGGDAAAAFSNSFIKRLVIRDAIYGMLRGLTNVAGDVAGDIAEAFGAKLPKGGLMVGFEKWIADGIFGILEGLNPALARADIATRGRNISQLQADETQRFHNELYKEDPRTFGKSSAQVNDEINRLSKTLEESQIANQRYHQELDSFNSGHIPGRNPGESDFDYGNRVKTFSEQRTFTPSAGANVTDSLLALLEDDTKKRLKQADFELGIAREKERMEKEAAHKDTSAEAKANRTETAAEKKAQAEADRLRRHEQAIEKNRKEHDLAAQRADLSLRAPEKDLSFTEKLIDHQKATSVAIINGGLFGRTDAAGALAQHAQTQITILRSIDAKLASIRSERSELTVL